MEIQILGQGQIIVLSAYLLAKPVQEIQVLANHVKQEIFFITQPAAQLAQQDI
jgi:hypothetical protein